MLADLSTCFSWLCFKLSLKFCKWIYFFIVVHCKQPGLFSMCYIKEPFKHWTLSAWIEPWGSLTWLKCCVLMMERMVLGVVWEKFLYLDNIKREIALSFIQQLKFPFFISSFFFFWEVVVVVLFFSPPHYSQIVRHLSVPRQHLVKWVTCFRVGQLQEASHQLNWTCRVKRWERLAMVPLRTKFCTCRSNKMPQPL